MPHIEHPLATGTRVDSSHPAMHLAFDKEVPVLRHRFRQGSQCHRDQPLIVEIRQRECVIPGQQPTQNSIGTMRVSGAFVIHTASSKRIEHEI